MYIFYNKQLAAVWFKICVKCNFNDNSDLLTKNTTEKKVPQSYLTEVLNFTKTVIFRKPTFNGLF